MIFSAWIIVNMGMETIIWGTVLVLIGIPFYFYEKRNWFKAMTGKD